ncbi:MAG TPA: arsenate reductase ArsC, partial [Dehalococcoidia bacterium]|nr:arsenate reductase ArsC [Dehalococcoidia bacterium]
MPLRAESAGTEPTEHVHKNVVEVMREVGLDLSEEQPKVITDEMVERARKVITMGCQVDAGTCPAVFIKGVEDWGLPDPKGKPLEQTRAIRDSIWKR